MLWCDALNRKVDLMEPLREVAGVGVGHECAQSVADAPGLELAAPVKRPPGDHIAHRGATLHPAARVSGW